MRHALPLLLVFAGCGIAETAEPPLAQACQGKTGLRVEAAGLRQPKGQLMCSLYDSQQGFPGDASAAIALAQASVGPDGACCEFGARPAGTYAVAVMHDVDGNQVLTKNGLGIPQEGFGASNDAKNHGTRPPVFEEAAFAHAGGDEIVELRMRYMAGPPKAQAPGSARKADGSCEETDLAGLEFSGPGWSDGSLTGLEQDEYFVHTTLLILNDDPAAQRHFQELNLKMLADLQTAPGLIGVTAAGSERCGFARTLGVWENERAMRSFVYGNESHIEAMAAFSEIAQQGQTAHWMASGDDLPPTWDQARGRLVDAPIIPGSSR